MVSFVSGGGGARVVFEAKESPVNLQNNKFIIGVKRSICLQDCTHNGIAINVVYLNTCINVVAIY